MGKEGCRTVFLAGVLIAASIVWSPPSGQAASAQPDYCTDSVASLTPLGAQSVDLGNDWVLTADTLGWCRKRDDPHVDNIVVARGKVKIQKRDQPAILSVDLSDMRLNELGQVAVTVERDAANAVQVVAPSYSGLGMQLQASNIIKYGGSRRTSEITLISDFPWRFFPHLSSANLILYPAFFRPVLTGISDGTFGWTGSFMDALAHEFEEGSLNLSIPFTVTRDTISTVSGHEPVLLLNVGTWFGKTFGLPVESVPVVLSQTAGDSHAKVKFDVSDVFGSLSSELLGVFTHIATIRNIFLKVNSADKLKLATKKAIVWGDAKIVKYSSAKLSPLLDEQRTQFLKDIEESKSHTAKNSKDIFKALGRFLAMVDNSEIDYDLINQDVALNPLYVQIGLFKAFGDFQGNIYAAFSKRGDPAWYFIDTLGLDVTMPWELTQVSSIPFFGLEKIPLAENPFQIGLGIVELGGTIGGLADPLYDVFHLAGLGGQTVDYSQWRIDAEVEGTLALVDSLELLSSTQEVGLPWPLTLKTTLDFKLGNQNGIAGTGRLSLFELVNGTGSFHFFIGDNAKPIDFQAGLSADAFGVSANGTLGSYFDTEKAFHLKMNTKIALKIAGHELAGLPFELGVAMNTEQITLSSAYSWGSHFCAWGHCLIHSGHKTHTHSTQFGPMGATASAPETVYAYGDTTVYAGAGEETLTHTFAVGSDQERLTISAQCSTCPYPDFSVAGPDGTTYAMDTVGEVVIDMNGDDLDMRPIDDVGDDTPMPHGFIVDALTGTTLFVLENPIAGAYSVTLADASDPATQVAAHTTPAMVYLSAADDDPQAFEIVAAYGDTLTVALRSANTHPGSTVTLYARPSAFRNTTYDYWHEHLFSATADPALRAHLTDQGDYRYTTEWVPELALTTLGRLETTLHHIHQVVTPIPDPTYLTPPLTRDGATTLQRNHTSIPLGEFSIASDGLHHLDLPIAANALSAGEYQLIARYTDRKDAPFVRLPYTLTVHNTDGLLPAPAITAIEETADGEALVHWHSSVDAADIAMVRLFLHDHGKGADDEVYLAYFDFKPGEAIRLAGLERDAPYSFSMALLESVEITDASGDPQILNRPGRRSETVSFTPRGPAFAGSPCVKLVDVESYARFEADGDLFVRLRILNESAAALRQAAVRIYLDQRREERLLADFRADLDGLAFADVHLTLPFELVLAAAGAEGETAALVYDIDSETQNELLTHDNAGVMEIENFAAFTAARESFHGTALLLNLKEGWNLVGDGILEDDIYDRFPYGRIYSHDGHSMQENRPNPMRGGGYFVYLPKDTHIVVAGTPMVPDLDHLNDRPWQLMGTGVDLYNAHAAPDQIPPGSPTYTPGAGCHSYYALQHTPDGETRWAVNPAVIEAGSGFWCIKEF